MKSITTPLSADTELVQPGVRLRPALLGDSLSAEGRAKVIALSGARPLRYMLEVAITWLTIAGLILIATYAHSLAVSVFCIFMISTRQTALALLMHDQVHRLGLRTKYGDWLVNLMIGYPLLVSTVEDYAKVHLAHHKYYFTSSDPDFLRKAGEEWTFPKSIPAILMIIARDITGLNVLRLIKGKKATKSAEFNRRNPSPRWLRIGFFVTLVTVLTLLQGWTIFLLYWMLPLLTMTQVLIRWGAVAEHEYNVEGGSVLDTTPIVELKWWQRIIFPDLNFGYHVYHHFHPGVSFSKLSEVHQIYRDEGLVEESAIFKGQGAYLKHLIANRHDNMR